MDQADPALPKKIWQILRHPETVQNLARVGKSYGAGAIRVGPRSLERPPIPVHLTLQFYEKKPKYPVVPAAN